ncbi:MAG: hypothetical protein A2V70_08255 [Planctomycetes bacterium RBG_13_63_9]|nr:MAG: hypothetical protein A2V70_08255 [Planctomycetes bacterium RBG_13_63_9]
MEIRNTHGRGDYRERWLEKDLFAYERSNSALILLNNRLDAGYDQRRVDVDFAWGTTLVELTGNAAADGNVPELVTVDNDYYEGPSKATVRSLRNDGGDRGYLVYGLAPPQAAWGVGLTNVAEVLPGGMPAANDYANGLTRLTDLHVITEDRFNVCLTTQPVTLSGTRLEDGWTWTSTSTISRCCTTTGSSPAVGPAAISPETRSPTMPTWG